MDSEVRPSTEEILADLKSFAKRLSAGLDTGLEGDELPLADGATILTNRNPVRFEPHRGLYREVPHSILPAGLAGVQQLLDTSGRNDPLVVIASKGSHSIYLSILPVPLQEFMLHKLYGRTDVASLFEREGRAIIHAVGMEQLQDDPNRPQDQSGLLLELNNSVLPHAGNLIDRFGRDMGGKRPSLDVDVKVDESVGEIQSETQRRVLHQILSNVVPLLVK